MKVIFERLESVQMVQGKEPELKIFTGISVDCMCMWLVRGCAGTLTCCFRSDVQYPRIASCILPLASPSSSTCRKFLEIRLVISKLPRSKNTASARSLSSQVRGRDRKTLHRPVVVDFMPRIGITGQDGSYLSVAIHSCLEIT